MHYAIAARQRTKARRTRTRTPRHCARRSVGRPTTRGRGEPRPVHAPTPFIRYEKRPRAFHYGDLPLLVRGPSSFITRPRPVLTRYRYHTYSYILRLKLLYSNCLKSGDWLKLFKILYVLLFQYSMALPTRNSVHF